MDQIRQQQKQRQQQRQQRRRQQQRQQQRQQRRQQRGPSRCLKQRTLTIRVSIPEWLTSCLTSLDLTKHEIFLFI